MADEETKSEQLTGSIFERVKTFFEGMWANIWQIDPKVFIPFWGHVSKALTDRLEASISERLSEGLRNTQTKFGMPEDIQAIITDAIRTNDTGSVTMGYLVTLMYYGMYFGGHASVAGEIAAHETRKKYRPTLPDVASLIVAMYRDPAQAEIVKDLMHKQGYSDENIDIIFKVSKSILAPDELKHLYMREEIDEETLIAGFKSYGFTDVEIERLRLLFYPIPGPSDLIRMAVREAFHPDYVEEFGLMDEYPEEFNMWAKRSGLSEDWAKKYWASHWELPSILRGYEMLHREVITSDQLDKLFMAADIMPFWRDKLKEISYNPLTRVDVRRVYNLGIIDRDQVFRTYKDLGYNDEKAEWLTKFTEMNNTQGDRDLTKAEILGAYAKHIVSFQEVNDLLLDLGYSPDEIEILVSMREYQEAKTNKTREMSRIEKYYLAGAYTANQAISELGKLDVMGSEQTSIMNLWDSQKLAKLRGPTKKELDSLMDAGVINESTYITEMRNLGYTMRYINWFLSLSKQQPEA